MMIADLGLIIMTPAVHLGSCRTATERVRSRRAHPAPTLRRLVVPS